MVHFVGAGPGAAGPDHSAGRSRLLQAGRCASSTRAALVNPALLGLAKTRLRHLQQRRDDVGTGAGCDAHHGGTTGKITVRLHTGDPCLYGAIREQMDALDQQGIAYDVTARRVQPSAARRRPLSAEYTLPEREPDGDHHPHGGPHPGARGGEAAPVWPPTAAPWCCSCPPACWRRWNRSCAAGGATRRTPRRPSSTRPPGRSRKLCRCTVGPSWRRPRRRTGITKTALIAVGRFPGRSDTSAVKAVRPRLYHTSSARGQPVTTAAYLAFTRPGCWRWPGGWRTPWEVPSTCRTAAGQRRRPILPGGLDRPAAWARSGRPWFLWGRRALPCGPLPPMPQTRSSDPAVVSVDEAGRFAVPLLSGHRGRRQRAGPCDWPPSPCGAGGGDHHRHRRPRPVRRGRVGPERGMAMHGAGS